MFKIANQGGVALHVRSFCVAHFDDGWTTFPKITDIPTDQTHEATSVASGYVGITLKNCVHDSYVDFAKNKVTDFFVFLAYVDILGDAHAYETAKIWDSNALSFGSMRPGAFSQYAEVRSMALNATGYDTLSKPQK